MKTIKFIIALCILGMLASCSSDDKDFENPDTPPTETDPPEETNGNVLYNGIQLPEPFPPTRSYTSDLEAGMNPFYLRNKPEVIDISVGRQLFVDNFLIENSTLRRKYHYPDYYPGNPVLEVNKDWEKVGNSGAGFAAPFSDGVWFDENDGKFKMWYMAGGGSYVTEGVGVTAYAESSDGVTWEKPVLNIFPGTNIVDNTPQRDASSIWLDKQEEDFSQKYKMFLVARDDGKWKYHYKTSSDGQIWRLADKSQALADRSTVYRNPFRDVWVFSMRHNVRVNPSKLVRARDYYENSNPREGTRNAEADLHLFWFGPWPNEQRHPRYPNVDPGIYNLDAIPYESIMLGLFSGWQGPENEVADANNEIKRNQIMLGYSRDGYHWIREDMNPFLAVDENKNSWNSGNLQSVVGTPLIVGDRLYFYLSGRKFDANGEEITTTGMASLRRDGFVSMEGTGTLTTEELKFDGEYLFVNASINGSLKVEILDANGSIIPGFSKDDFKSFTGNDVKAKIAWKEHTSLSSLKDEKIKLKFYIENGELFSFWISPWESGESRGYTGGGGPDLNPTGIDKPN